jgi:flagellar hook-basal body complex protein FliE
MSIEAISGVATAASALQPMAEPAMISPELAIPTIPELSPPDGVSFDTLVNSIEALNQKLVAGTDAVHAVALGQVDNMHQAMMSGEQTRLAFDLMLQVRGKVLDAYQELLRMQV